MNAKKDLYFRMSITLCLYEMFKVACYLRKNVSHSCIRPKVMFIYCRNFQNLAIVWWWLSATFITIHPIKFLMFPTGDQGFLNSYYAGFANARLFEPDMSEEVLKTRSVPEMERLSTLYNADVGLYMLANKVSLSENT